MSSRTLPIHPKRIRDLYGPGSIYPVECCANGVYAFVFNHLELAGETRTERWSQTCATRRGGAVEVPIGVGVERTLQPTPRPWEWVAG